MAYDLKERKIHVGDLRIGMRVVRLDCAWEDTDFLIQNFIIQDLDEIAALQAQCQHVFIEEKVLIQASPKPSSTGSSSRGLRQKRPKNNLPNAASPTRRVTYINKVNVSRELGTARTAYEDARNMAKGIMDTIRLGRTVDINQARAVVDECVGSVLRNNDALLLLTKLKHKHEYTAEHCINVCVLTATFARHLGMLEEEIKKIALCGLLHDVGKSRIPDEILDKPGALTPEEYKAMQEHAAFGRDILMAANQVDNSCVDVAYSHHERMDGGGYPRGLKATHIPYFAKVVAVADAYDAITSNRAYDNGRASMEALDIIHRGRGRQFDEELAKEFIRCIGIYPPGSLVLLNSGEVGIVTASNPKNKLRPKMLLVRDEQQGKREKYRMIDLIDGPSFGAGESYSIVKELPDGAHGVYLKNFLERGLVLDSLHVANG